MSYKALYRTYRPKNFQEIKGQNHIVSTLKNIIINNKISHAYLFAGPRGTGKTSAANVFAKTLNCSNLKDQIKPCGECKQCISIEKTSLDIIEIDAASNNGVTEIRTIIDNSKYLPSISKYKIYIIDEIHMLSKGAFNAMLKTLEDPPIHIIFILATTEPHKIPITILSRVQRFNFRRISNNVILINIKIIMDKEKIQYVEESLKLITKLANGSMRDALSIIDQVAVYSNNKISFEAISQVFGIVSFENQIKFIQLIENNKTKEVILMSNQFIDNGVNISKFVESLIIILKDWIIFKKTNDLNLMELITKEEINNINISLVFAYKTIEILMKLLSNLKFSEMPRQAFELSLLKIMALNPNPLENPTNKILQIKEEEKEKPTNLFNASKKIKNNNEEEINTKDTKNIENNEEIISTQEIYLKKTQELKPNNNKKNLTNDLDQIKTDTNILENKDMNEDIDEINLMNLFENNEDDNQKITKEENNKIIQYPISEIINLLMQTKKELIIKAKKNWLSILSHIYDSKFEEFASALNLSKLIAVGDEFILVASEKEDIVNKINNFRKQNNFINFIKLVFGKPQLLFAITKDKFEIVKKTWIEMQNNDSFPKTTTIHKLKVQEVEKNPNNVEKFGTKLFGDIFKS